MSSQALTSPHVDMNRCAGQGQWDQSGGPMEEAEEMIKSDRSKKKC